ncbi:MAG: S9 family peptidase, partial [Actinomycetota bacterium]|nr:S9 family peptidase [Actinomycetota bacterium]
PDQLDLDTFLAMPRLSDLRLSPDGSRLVVAVATPDDDRKRYTSALWELDPDGAREPRRLTRSPRGESSPAFLPGGDLLFVSERAGSDDADDSDTTADVWLLPTAGGEARLVAEPPGGVAGLTIARDAGHVILGVPTYPGAATWEDDAGRDRARRDAGVRALLFTTYPIRWWDHWLGPRQRRLWHGRLPGHDEGRLQVRDLTPDVGDQLAIDNTVFDVTPDGATVVTSWQRLADDPRQRTFDLVAVDVGTRERRVLLHDDDHWYSDPRCSPDGRAVACLRTFQGDPQTVTDTDLVVVDLDDGGVRTLVADVELWPDRPVWTPDGAALLFTADQAGHRPVFRVSVDDGRVTRLTAGGAYSDVDVTPDGGRVVALGATMQRPPHPVILDATAPDQHTPGEIPSPAAALHGPGRVERLTARATDGTSIASWLVLPPAATTAGPAPLVVFIHGGPLGTWNSWHWRWNPHVLASQGYAVLCPDPALSTGYGLDLIRRGWGRWGAEPYTDVIAAVEHAARRDDIDPTRVAAMGGSFGGYMANWIAGHTDRFRAIVTHASLWALDGFHGTTDLGVWWEREFGDPYVDPARYREQSPHQHVGAIRTPMLVIHGENDHRVPISEALRLWTDLSRHGVDAQLLYFPDEHHWIAKPQNARLWYRTVLAFLDHHLRGRPWERPELL